MASIMTRPNGSGQSMGKRRAAASPRKRAFWPSLISPMNLTPAVFKKGCDAFPEIGLVSAVDFCGDLERHAGRTGDFNGAIDAFLRRDAAQEGKIIAGRSEG